MASNSWKLTVPEPSASISSINSAMPSCSTAVRGCMPSETTILQTSRVSSSPLWSESNVLKRCLTSSWRAAISCRRSMRMMRRRAGKEIAFNSPNSCTSSSTVSRDLLEQQPKSQRRLRISSLSR